MKSGGELEKKANLANIRYKNNGYGIILRVPVPLEITSKGLIARQSTVDFCGILRGGKFIAFDAKETKVKTRFDLANIHAHQYAYLQGVEELGGIAFFLIHFKSIHPDKAFIATPSFLSKYWGTQKSIPINDFDECPLVEINTYLSFLNS